MTLDRQGNMAGDDGISSPHWYDGPAALLLAISVAIVVYAVFGYAILLP